MIEAIAARVSEGTAITDTDARAILASHDLIAVGMMGDDVRRRMHGTRTTFVRVFEVHVDAPPASLPANLTAGEIRIVGRPASVDAAMTAVKATAAAAGRVPVSGFSLDAISALAGPSRPLYDICAGLREAGLALISEVAVDAGTTPDDIATARRAGLLILRLIVNQLGDEDDRIGAIMRARDLQSAAGGFHSFAPLPRTTSVTRPSTGYDDVKQVAVARLLAERIPSIQVDWPIYGPKLAQVALTMGADDVDGIAAVETGVLGTRRSAIEEIRGNIRAASLEAVERNARWEDVGA